MKRLLNGIRNFWIFGIRYRWVEVGRDVVCQLSARFWSQNKRIRIGNRVGIGFHCLFQSDVSVGNDVMIASFASFINSDDHRHDVVGKSMRDSGRGDAHGIVIGDDVWIGLGAIVLSPADIGRGSIVAAGSVVKGRVEPYSIVAGVPARTIRMRFTPEQISEHERLLAVAGKSPLQ